MRNVVFTPFGRIDCSVNIKVLAGGAPVSARALDTAFRTGPVRTIYGLRGFADTHSELSELGRIDEQAKLCILGANDEPCDDFTVGEVFAVDGDGLNRDQCCVVAPDALHRGEQPQGQSVGGVGFQQEAVEIVGAILGVEADHVAGLMINAWATVRHDSDGHSLSPHIEPASVSSETREGASAKFPHDGGEK